MTMYDPAEQVERIEVLVGEDDVESEFDEDDEEAKFAARYAELFPNGHLASGL